MNNRNIFAIIAPFLFIAPAIAQSLYAPQEGWPPCAVMTAVGEKVPDGLAVTGVICRTTVFIPDSDADGVSNDADRCPGTPTGTEVNGVGCPLDGDNDGVPDHLDRCADTPVAAGVDVDSNGCPVDDDNDGVPNHLDRCPNTPAGAKVNDKGCPAGGGDDGASAFQIPCPATTGNKIICSGPVVLDGVHFEFDSARLTPEAREALNKVAGTLYYYPDLKITVAGYTDNIGSADYNQLLSQLRAEAAMNYLVSRDIDPARLKAVGHGEKHPIASNETEEGRAKNRRVEILTPADR